MDRKTAMELQSLATDLKIQGDNFSRNRAYNIALDLYQQALETQTTIPHTDVKIASLLIRKADVYNSLDETHIAIRYYIKAVEINRAIQPVQYELIVDSLDKISRIYLKINDWDNALEFAKQGLWIRKKYLTDKSKEIVAGMMNIKLLKSKIMRRQGDRNYRVMAEHEAYRILQHLNNKGLTLYNQFKFGIALDYYQEALEIKQKQIPDKYGQTYQILKNIGDVYIGLGQYENALNFYNQILDDRSRSEWWRAVAYDAIGKTYGKMEQFDRAVVNFNLELTILLTLGKSTVVCLKNLGNVYYDLGEYAKGLEYFQIAMSNKSTIPAEASLEIASVVNCIGNTYVQLGDLPRALERYEKAYEIQKHLYKNRKSNFGIDVELAGSLNNIGFIYCQKGDLNKALYFHTQALEMQRHELPAKHVDIAGSLNNVGNVYFDKCLFQLALDSYKEASKILRDILPESSEQRTRTEMNVEKLVNSKLAIC